MSVICVHSHLPAIGILVELLESEVYSQKFCLNLNISSFCARHGPTGKRDQLTMLELCSTKLDVRSICLKGELSLGVIVTQSKMRVDESLNLCRYGYYRGLLFSARQYLSE